MSTPVNTSSTDSQMHNNIMAASSKDRPPMLGPGRYSHPYVPTSVLIQAVPEAEGRPAVQQHTAIETVLNMTPENKEHFQSEKEAIFLLLTGIGDEIYSTVDACNTANEMWIAIERLQQGESLNVQDVKTNLFWEFGKFTSRDGESMESYYSRFYKLMNELTRNNLQVTTMQVNVQFLQQLQPECFRRSLIDIRAERIAKSANPLALIAAAQPYSDTYYQAPKPQRSNATSSSTRQSASTRHKGKEVAKPITPQSESVSEEDRTRLKIPHQGIAMTISQGSLGNQRTLTVAGGWGNSRAVSHVDWLDDTMKRIDETGIGSNITATCKDSGGLTYESVLWKDDSNVTLDSSNICTNDNQVDQNAAECVDERAALANLIANLTLDTEENKTILKQLKKANASLTQELEKCKTNLDETNKSSSLLTKSQLEGYLKENTKVISDLKVKEDKYIDKMIEMDKQLKFLNEIDYTKQNSLYEIFKAPSLEYLYQLERAKEVRKTMWRKPFVLTKPNIAKNVAFLPVSKSISKSRQVFNEMTFNINQFREIVDQTWFKHTSDYFRVPTAHDMELLIKTFLMPLSIKSQNDSFRFEHELKTEMHEDFEYVKSLEKEIDELESEKADFSNMYDLLLEECVSKDVICSYLHSLSELNAQTELQCMYLHKVKECECLAQKLSKQTESVNNEVYNKLLKSFAKLEKHSISLELSLQHCKEQMKNNPVCKENASNVFRKEREQYHEIQDLKAQMQDKNMVINELKKLILVTKGKSVETQFDKPSVVRQPNAQRIPKPSVLGKPTPFSNSPEMRSFQTNKSVNKTNASDGLFKLVTQQNLPQNRNQAVRNTNVLKPGMFRIASTTTQTRTPQLPHASRNTNPHMSKSSGVIHTTSVSRPQLKCYQVKDKVVPNNSQVKFTKKEVEDNHRISSISKKTKSVTACNDSSNSRTSNANAVCADCGKCVFNSDHDACVSRYLKDVNARTKKPKVVPISASKPKRKANKSVATPHKKTVASDTTIQKSKSYYKELYENTNQEWKWWIAKRCPSGYTWTQKPLRTKKIWMPKIRKADESTSISPTIDIVSRITNIVQLILFIVDSGCTKHMTGNLKLLCNFVEKFLGTVRFGNDQFAPILGYGDLIQGNVTIKRVYYVEGLNHNLFSVGQFCDADLEVAFRKSTCFVRDLQGNGCSNCFTPTQAWVMASEDFLHLNFDYITLLLKKRYGVQAYLMLTYVKDQLCCLVELE
ncbi:hypothetical protein Tco_1236069 [Tanacetum coccineum]